MQREEWEAEGARRFGPDRMTWKFVCPSCGHVASAADWRNAGAPSGAVAFSCVGRWLKNPKRMGERPGPCNYAGGGLFAINPLDVDGLRVFDFAPSEPGT
jgi:hypothetical protein